MRGAAPTQREVDRLYGRLLRRAADADPGLSFALVLPDAARKAALRVPESVRRQLRIAVDCVGAEGGVAAVR